LARNLQPRCRKEVPVTTSSDASPEARRRHLATRLVAAFRLEPALFDEIEHDPRALGQAILVVTAGGLAQGIARFGETGGLGLLVGIVSALALWLAATAVVYLAGVRWLGGTSGFVELLRTLGFAATPLLLLVLCAIATGVAASLVYAVAHLLAAAGFFVALRQALDMETSRALLVCVAALAAGLIVLFVVGLLVSGPPGA
jgi:hypothetical protein